MSALRTRPSVDKAICRRDLASPDLWDRSLQRSRERRRIAEIHRRTAPRRKGVSLAVSAALLASPVFPRFASAHSGSNVGTSTENTGGPGAPQAPKLLERGDTSSAVKQVQRALGVTEDGIFGPITEGAVMRFQGHEGLPRTGRVDPTTWMKLFSGNVTVLEAGTPEAQAVQTAAGDDPTPPAVPAGSDPAGDESATPVARPAAFQPAVEERATKSSRDEPSATRDSGDEPRRTRRASSDDRDRTPSRRSEPTGEDRDRGSTQPAPDKREDPAPSPTPAPSGGGGGGGGGGSCDGDFARPVNGTVTGVFGENRGGRSHEGMDIAAPSGTPIKAATCGRVSEAGFQGGYGNIICIRASESFTTCYAHMSRFGASVGQYVKIGEVIGYVGCTGSCTGPHVHFEVRLNGQKVDPAPYINGSRKAPSARSSSTMAVSFTDSTRKTREARALKREQVSRQHDEAAQDPAQQPQISTAATEGDAGQAGSSTPTDQAASTTASTDAPAAAADPSTQAADPSASVPADTTAAVEDTTGQGSAGADTGAVEETAGSTVDETTSTVEETTGTETPGTDGGAVDETTSSVEEDASSVDETTSSVDETTSSVEEDASSAVDETTGTDAPGSDTSGVDETTSSVEEDASSAVDETTGAVEETTGSSGEESDAPGEDDSSTSSDEGSSSDAAGEDGSDTSSDEGSSSDAAGEDDSDTSSDEGSSGDAAGEDGAGSEEPAGATAGG